MDEYENTSVSPENPEENTPSAEPVEAPEAPTASEIPTASEAPAASVTPEAASTQEAPEDNTYRNAGAGRKESPYADSPYEMYRPEEPPKAAATPAEPPKEKTEKKKHSGLGKRILAVAAAVVLVVASCGVTAGLVNSYWEEQTSNLESSLQAQISALEAQIAEQSSSSGSTVSVSSSNSASQVYADNVDSVVLISSTIVTTQYGQTVTGTSTGSGFILTENGYVVTNYHVVEDGTSITVTLYNGDVYDAELVGYDDINDVAVLKVEAEGLSAVTLGSSDDLQVGDQVVAIGNPLGELTSTLTGGYVSGKERSISTDGTVINMLQTDCAINSGNSGGPLFNMNGEVVGITTAKYSGETSSGASIEGIGFAIPIDDVVDVIYELIDYGYVQTGYLGVTVMDMDSSTASLYGLPVGAYVVSVEEGSGAYAAGIQAQDLIIGLGDTTIESVSDLTRALRDYAPGETAVVTVYRSGQELQLNVTLGEKPSDTDSSDSTDSDMPEGDYEEWYNYFSPFFNDGTDGN